MSFKNGDFVIRRGGKWAPVTGVDFMKNPFIRVWLNGRATGGFRAFKSVDA